MNYVIGLCKGNKNWVSTLRDLHYNVEIIEQNIRTSGGELVKPDIIKTSKKFNHCIIFECKSGTGDIDQMDRYDTLTSDDLSRWVDVPTKELLKFDVCVVDFENNHSSIEKSTNFPIITFGENTIKKTNGFSQNDLNNAFSSPIDITGMMPPLGYYPFSEQDSDQVIIPRILRAMITIVLKKARGGPDVFNQAIYEMDDVLQLIHPLWKGLAEEHKKTLKDRVKQLFSRLVSNTQLSEYLRNIQQDRFRVRGPAQGFTNLCQIIINESVKQTTFDQKF